MKRWQNWRIIVQRDKITNFMKSGLNPRSIITGGHADLWPTGLLTRGDLVESGFLCWL
jgi:hypothetical protein